MTKTLEERVVEFNKAMDKIQAEHQLNILVEPYIDPEGRIKAKASLKDVAPKEDEGQKGESE